MSEGGSPPYEEPVAVRLTRIEERQRAHLETTQHGIQQLTEAMESGFTRVTVRLDTINGSVREHAVWINAHREIHAVDTARDDTRASLRRSEWSYLIGAIALINFSAPLVERLLISQVTEILSR